MPKINSVTNSFIRGSSVATILRTFGRGAVYIFQIILARTLAPEGFGIFALGWTILRLFSIVGHLGLDFGVIHFGSRYWKRNLRRLSTTFFLSLGGAFLSGLLFGTLLYLFSPWLAEAFFRKPDLEYVLKGFALTFPLVTTLRVTAAASSISGKMLCGGIAEDVAQPLLQILLYLVIRRAGSEITAALTSTVISYLLSTTLGFICVKRSFPGLLASFIFKPEEIAPLLKYSTTTILAVVIGTFNLWGDRLIVGYFRNNADTGIYQSISLITMITTTMLSGIKAVIAPTASKLYHEQKHSQLNSLIQRINRYILYLSLPVLLIVTLIPGDVIEVIFGAEYKSGALALSLLSLGQLFYLMTGLVDQFFIATGKQISWLTISSSVFILTILLDAILIPKLGLTGAAVVSCSMMLLMNILSIISARKNLDFQLISRQHVKIYIAFALTGLLTLLCLHFINSLEPLQHLIFTATTSTILFTLIVVGLGLESDDKAIINKLVSGNRRLKL